VPVTIPSRESFVGNRLAILVLAIWRRDVRARRWPGRVAHDGPRC